MPQRPSAAICVHSDRGKACASSHSMHVRTNLGFGKLADGTPEQIVLARGLQVHREENITFGEPARCMAPDLLPIQAL